MIRMPLNTRDALGFAKSQAHRCIAAVDAIRRRRSGCSVPSPPSFWCLRSVRRRFSSGGPPCAKLLTLSLERLKIALCSSAM